MTNRTDRTHKVGVVGGGVVGKALAAYYGEMKIYDKYHPVDAVAEVGKCDVIFVAVPTPFTGHPDLTEMDNAIATVVKHLSDPEKQIIIIKSTVVPGTTDRYQARYPHVNFVFNPEFLTEKTATEDFAHPDKQLVGFTEKTRELASLVMDILPGAPYKKILPAKACEIAKYTINSYYAFKVIFANCIYDYAGKVGADYNQVREGLAADRRIVDSHFDVLHGGYRGYGGKCLPKDIKTLAWYAKEQGVPAKFIESIIALNEKLGSKGDLYDG